MVRNSLIIALSLLAGLSSQNLEAKTRKVLFIGNSYIYTNDMPLMLQKFATSKGDTLSYDQNTPGGYTLQQHSADATTLAKIAAQQWDMVLLQEQSQRPAFPPQQVASDTYPYAQTLNNLVKQNDSCTQTLFLMTWGYKNGDASNCQFYPVICTYEGMQSRLRESYTQMAADNHALLAPAGAAWKMVRDSVPAIDLYSPDNSHPSLAGSYLEACVLYASIFHKSPLGGSYTAGLAATDAATLQYFASKIAFDSLSKWTTNTNYPSAAFAKTVTSSSVSFQNQSQKATTYLWNFGDGTTSTQASPTHNYTASGKFAVTLQASNGCLTESYTDSVTINTTGINTLPANNESVSLTQLGDGRFHLQFTAGKFRELAVYDLNGRLVKRNLLDNNQQHADGQLNPGHYIYRLFPQASQDAVVTGRMPLW